MTTAQKLYHELITLTQRALSQEKEKKKWIFTSPGSYAYYRAFAKQNRPQKGAKTAAHEPAPPPPASLEPVTPPPKPKATTPPKEEPKKQEQPAAPPKAKTAEKQKGAFKLEPLAEAAQAELSDIKKAVQEVAPQIRVLEEAPKAPENNKDRPLEVVILSFTQEADELTFLQSLARAISDKLGRAQVVSADRIDKQKAWDKLLETESVKLILAGDYGLYHYGETMRRHRCDKETACHYLGDKPLLMLSSPETYTSQPELKRVLWKAVTTHYEPSVS